MDTNERNLQKEITDLFRSDPQAAMALVVEHYTGLIWSVVSQYLTNPEDIKECVNDTLMDFYQNRGSFDAEKGKLSTFLATIARNKAVSQYRKNRIREAEPLIDDIPAEADSFEQLIAEMDLERAIASLNPEEARVIRMKYYDGMSVREIADSLNLPYETIKKRQQRSLSKMKLILLAVLITLLVAVAAACAYVILDYFGILPGYGVNRNEDISLYILEEPVTVETDDFTLRLTKAVLANDCLLVTGIFDPAEGLSEEEARLLRDAWNTSTGLLRPDGSELPVKPSSATAPAFEEATSERSSRFEYRFDDFPRDVASGDSFEVILRVNDSDIPITLVSVSEKPIDEYSYDLGRNGGVAAIPCLEEGHLMVDIYPLEKGEYKISPGLVLHLCGKLGGPVEDVTATAEDGTVLTGECVRYSPMSNNLYFRWDFGPAEPGTYTLTVPYLFLYAPMPEDLQLVVSDAEPGIGTSFEVPGSTVTIADYTPEFPPGMISLNEKDLDSSYITRCLLFDFEEEYDDMVLVDLSLDLEQITEFDSSWIQATSRIWTESPDGFLQYRGIAWSWTENVRSGEEPLRIYARNGTTEPYGNVIYRWNHRFELPITVE